MKAFKTLSRVANFILIFCFFLPFAPMGCGGPSGQELAEKSKQDSVHVADSLKLYLSIGMAEPAPVVPDSIDKVIVIPDSIKNPAAALKTDTTYPCSHKETVGVPEALWSVVLNRMIQPPNAISGFGFVWFGIGTLTEGRTAWYGVILIVGFVMSYLSVLFLAFYALWKRAYAGKLMFGLSLVSWVYFLVFFFMTLSLHEMLYGFWTTASVWMLNLVLIWYIHRREKAIELKNG